MQHKICPHPSKWDEFYRLIGSPRNLGPFVLSGWAFSTHRQKRDRFRAQVEHAYAIGLQQQVDHFLSELRDDEWFFCSETSLDFDYGESLREEYEEKSAREEEAREQIKTARLLFAELRSLSKIAATSPDHIECFLFRWSVQFLPSAALSPDDNDERIAAIEASLRLEEQTEWDHPAPECVEEQLNAFKVNLVVELLLLKLLRCHAKCRNLDEDADFWLEVLRDPPLES